MFKLRTIIPFNLVNGRNKALPKDAVLEYNYNNGLQIVKSVHEPIIISTPNFCATLPGKKIFRDMDFTFQFLT